MTLLTICVRWCSLPRMLCPLATSSSNSSNFCSICMSSSAATGLRPSVPVCRAASEKMRDLVSSVHELIRGEEGRVVVVVEEKRNSSVNEAMGMTTAKKIKK